MTSAPPGRSSVVPFPAVSPHEDDPYVVHVMEAYGGIETYLRLLLDHWPSTPRFGFVLAHQNSLAADLRDRGFPVEVVPMPRTRWRVAELRSALRLRRTLRRMAPDVVHLHSSQAGLVGRIAWGRRRHRTIYTPHAFFYLGRTGASRQVFLWAERVLARLFFSELVATSPSEAGRALGQVRVPLDRVSTVLNAVEPTTTTPRQAPAPRPRITMVSRIAPQKNIPMYLSAIARLRSEGFEADFEIIGVGHYDQDRHGLGQLLEEAGLGTDDVTIRPWMAHDDLLAHLGTCDLAVLTSTYESFGYSLAEAIARGVPVLGTNVDGIRDVVVHGENGFLVRLGDVEALAARIRQVLSEPGLYHQLSRGALASARTRLDIRVLVASLRSHYVGGPTARSVELDADEVRAQATA